jgi:hypothetical protein
MPKVRLVFCALLTVTLKVLHGIENAMNPEGSTHAANEWRYHGRSLRMPRVIGITVGLLILKTGEIILIYQAK